MRYRRGLEKSFKEIDMILIQAKYSKNDIEKQKLITIAKMMLEKLR